MLESARARGAAVRGRDGVVLASAGTGDITQTTFESLERGCWLWRREACGQSGPAAAGRVGRTGEPLARRWRASVDGAAGAIGHGLTRLAAVDAAARAAADILPVLEKKPRRPVNLVSRWLAGVEGTGFGNA